MMKTDWQLKITSPKGVIVTFFWNEEQGWQRDDHLDGRFDVWEIKFPGTDTFHGFVVWVMRSAYELAEDGWRIRI